jgi:hypothetical protein
LGQQIRDFVFQCRIHVGSLVGGAMRVYSYFPGVSRLSWCMSASSLVARAGAMSTSRFS